MCFSVKILCWVLLIPFAALACFARLLLWGTFDAEGMPLPLSAESLAMPALLAVAAVIFFLLARRLPAQRTLCADMGSYFRFSAGKLTIVAVGCLLYLAGAGLSLAGGKAGISLVLAGLLAAGAACLLVAAAALQKGKSAPGVLLLVPVVALVLRLIFFYREHTADPFLRDYYVELLALAAMTLLLLEFAAFAFRGGAPRLFIPLGEVCVILCAAAITAAWLGCFGMADLAFYGGSLFLALGLLSAADFDI